ncbi:MAG: DUF4389 domain-containing protein [Oryzihumus sp.]
MSTAGYPVRVDARLDPGLSRWLWLVKWLLAIPHYLVLLVLWAAFVVLSIVAFFAILFTGHYPRAIFDFNVGVLRWSWRVGYYAYGALGTDRYPPFTLDEVPDYPAHLEVAYPERLSRGLVLVKTWLLALPHYLVVAFFAGGSLALVSGDNRTRVWSSGLIGLMVLVGAVVLLVTGRYPQSVFDFVLGMNRWVLRVAAYAALMTDEYPPFRFDPGGDDPSAARMTIGTPPPQQPIEAGQPVDTTAPQAAAPPAGSTAPPPATMAQTAPPAASAGARKWTGGRIVSVVAGAVLLAGSLGLLAASAGLGVLNLASRDRAGFVTTASRTFATSTSAIASSAVQVGASGQDWSGASWALGDAGVRAESLDPRPVFIGVAHTADAAAWLAGVDHSTVIGFRDGAPVYRDVTGGTPSVPPEQAGIWAASVSGTGPQELVWPIQSSDWTVVVMHPDGSPGVIVRADAGATLPVLHWLWVAPLVVALVLIVAGVLLVVLAIPRAART